MPKEQETAQVLKRLRKEGWKLQSGKGSHVVARRNGVQLAVPTSKKEVAIGTYRKIAKTAGWL
jgi:predicted RNA binding protein YcfA (HicA-like mRNA interferase family)